MWACTPFSFRFTNSKQVVDKKTKRKEIERIRSKEAGKCKPFNQFSISKLLVV